MDEEIKSLIKVWITIFVSLSYSYFISRKIPKGKLRLISLLPIVTIFTLLPLSFSSVNLSGNIGFTISWIANFKLLLFAFDQGPLSKSSTLLSSLPLFISIACLPIKIQHSPSPQITNKVISKPNNTLVYVVKVLVLAVLIRIYDYRGNINPTLLLCLYSLHIYLSLEITLAIAATSARSLLGLELEPQFNEPYRSTSLQDFWGRRWNLMITTILRPTVYDPTRRFFSPLIGKNWASICGIVTTFVVSGLMHELLFFYMGQPTGEVIWFFVLHGVFLAVEIVIKKCLNGRFRLHPVVSTPLTVGFVMMTSFWLFFPPMLRDGFEAKAFREFGVVINFVLGLSQTMIDFLGRIGSQNV